MKNSNIFWISYADIMTSLFFILLVLFVVSFSLFRSEMNRADRIEIEFKKYQEITAIEEALTTFDDRYFDFDAINKRYRLNINVRFEPDSADIFFNNNQILENIYQAGKEIYVKINEILEENERAHLLLIIEGNAQRICDDWILQINCNWRSDNGIVAGYELSYRRALALFNFWKARGLDLNDLTSIHNGRFEAIIAGSGHFGLSRADNEFLNRRFTLQITSKYTLEPG